MKEFELFKKVIVGNFNNLKQVEEEKNNGEVIHPICKHINGICNDKIMNLPADFNSIFVIEESYYTDTKTDRTNILPHLFLFEETESGQVRLVSYEIPKRISKKDFTNANQELELDYNELEISSKFNPMTYTYKKGEGFYGRSLSDFGNGMTFLLDETLSENKFEVNEVLKREDRVIIGYESPIIYYREV